MTKAVEQPTPYSDEMLAKAKTARFLLPDPGPDVVGSLLATIKADREKLAEITDQAARQIAASGMAINELKERTEAAEARVSELEALAKQMYAALEELSEWPSSQPIESNVPDDQWRDMRFGQMLMCAANALPDGTRWNALFPTPPVKGEG